MAIMPMPGVSGYPKSLRDRLKATVRAELQRQAENAGGYFKADDQPDELSVDGKILFDGEIRPNQFVDAILLALKEEGMI